jgi:hypothetical protein
LLQGSGGISPPSAINNHTQNHSSYAGAGKQSQPRGKLEIHKIIQAAPGRANEANQEAA